MRRRAFIIINVIVLLFFISLLYSNEINKQLGTKITTHQVRQTQRTKQLPDLIVERVWLDEQGNIVFSIKNAGRGVISDSEHGQSRVRVQYGNKALDFWLTKNNPNRRPPVDGKGALKRPGGAITYITGIKLSSPTAVSVIVDYNKRVKEANEQNNQSQAITLKPVVQSVIQKVQETIKQRVTAPKKPEAKPEKAQPTQIPQPQEQPETPAQQVQAQQQVQPVFETNIEDGEPNNTIFQATALQDKGWYSGAVGDSSDPVDFLKITTGSGGYCHLLTIQANTRNVQLSLYDPKKSFLVEHPEKVWIALTPETTFYFSVRSLDNASAAYNITITSKVINDPREPDDSFKETLPYTLKGLIGDENLKPPAAYLCNAMDSSGSYRPARDWYQIDRLLTKLLPYQAGTAMLISIDNTGASNNDLVGVYLFERNSYAAPIRGDERYGEGQIMIYIHNSEWWRIHRQVQVELSGHKELFLAKWDAGYSLFIENKGNTSNGLRPYGIGDPPRRYTVSYQITYRIPHFP